MRMYIVGETLVQWLRLRLRWREFTLGDLMCGNGNHQQLQPIWKWRRWLLWGSHRVDSEILSFKSLEQLSERAKVWSNNSPLAVPPKLVHCSHLGFAVSKCALRKKSKPMIWTQIMECEFFSLLARWWQSMPHHNNSCIPRDAKGGGHTR